MRTKNIVVTGSDGFIGGHLLRKMMQEDGIEPVPCDRETFQSSSQLGQIISQASVVLHFAGVNRGSEEEVATTNKQLAAQLISAIRESGGSPHVIFASTTQRDNNSPYGQSKRAAENLLIDAGKELGFPVTVLVIPNVFGPGCRPFYNSVVATFCHQLAVGETPEIIEDREVEFVSVYDLATSVTQHIQRPANGIQFIFIPFTAVLNVSEVLERLSRYHDLYFHKNVVPDISNPLDASLYATFLSHIRLDAHRHRPTIHTDERGRLFEIIKLNNGGQIFFSTTRPGVVRGNHYHTRKIEWFCVLKGNAVIRLRRIGHGQIREFYVSGEQPEFISIPVLHSHSIENVGDEELLTMFWCSEIFDAADPDTIYEKVA